MTSKDILKNIENNLKFYPDFPKAGILFRDIFPICREPKILSDLIDLLVTHIKEDCKGTEVIVGLESRGFIFGPLISQKLGVAFVPIRKKGKLPGDCVSVSYQLEYGSDQFEVQKDSLQEGQKVVIIDDLLATGGTMKAAEQLMEKLKVNVLECVVIVELCDLKGRDKITNKVWSLLPQWD